jgi:hypothetical protein
VYGEDTSLSSNFLVATTDLVAIMPDLQTLVSLKTAESLLNCAAAGTYLLIFGFKKFKIMVSASLA